MGSNTHSPGRPAEGGPPDDGLAALAADIDALAAQDLQGLPDTVRAERVLAWRQLLPRPQGLWVKELAALAARAPAGPTTVSTLGRRRPGCGGGCGGGAGAVRAL